MAIQATNLGLEMDIRCIAFRKRKGTAEITGATTSVLGSGMADGCPAIAVAAQGRRCFCKGVASHGRVGGGFRHGIVVAVQAAHMTGVAGLLVDGMAFSVHCHRRVGLHPLKGTFEPGAAVMGPPLFFGPAQVLALFGIGSHGASGKLVKFLFMTGAAGLFHNLEILAERVAALVVPGQCSY